MNLNKIIIFKWQNKHFWRSKQWSLWSKSIRFRSKSNKFKI